MKKLELLVKRARKTIDDVNASSIDDYEMMTYFNDAQKAIQSIVYAANQNTGKFSRILQYPFQSASQTVFNIPRDAFLEESINSVGLIGSNGGLRPMDRIDYSESGAMFGYSIEEGAILLSDRNNSRSASYLNMSYVYKLPSLSYQIGTVQTVDILTNKIKLNIGFKDGFELEDEYITVCDYKGNTKARYLYISNWNPGNRTLTLIPEDIDLDGTALDLSAVAVGDIISLGEYSTTHCELPEVCEPLLTSHVQRRCLARTSSKNVEKEVLFTSEEENRIRDLFADSAKAPASPPVRDTDYLGY